MSDPDQTVANLRTGGRLRSRDRRAGASTTSPIFVSYAREDSELVRKLHAALNTAEREVWVDLERIPPSADWLAEIRAAIESCVAFVFIISPESVASPVCNQELEHAAMLGKRIVPVAHRAVPQELMPKDLATRQWIQLRDDNDFDATLEELTRAIDTDFDWVRAHTRISVRAREWEKRNHDKSQLLRGADLENAEQLQATHQQAEPAFTELQSRYILASRRAAVAFQRKMLAAVSSGLIVALTLAATAYYQFTLSQRRQRIALARQLAAQSLGHIELQHDLALLLAVEAFRTTDLAEARRSLLTGLQRHPRLAAWFYMPEPEFGGQMPRMLSLAVSPDGTWLAASDACAAIERTGINAFRCAGGKIMLWRLQEPPVLADSLTIPTGIQDVTFSPDGKTLLAIDWDGALRSHQVGAPMALRAQTAAVRGGGRALAVSPDGRLIAMAGEGAIRVLDARRPDSQLSNYAVHQGVVWDLAFSPGGRLIASAGDDGVVGLWRDGASSKLYGHGKGPLGKGVKCVAFNPDGTVLASGGDDGNVRLWDVQIGSLLDTLRYHVSQISDVAFSPDGALLASASWDKRIALWDVESRQRLPGVLDGHVGYPDAIVFTPDGRLLITGDSEGDLALWHVPVPRDDPEPSAWTPSTFAVAFSPTGEWAVSSRGERVILWNPETGEEIAALEPTHERAVQRVSASHDGRLLASAASDRVTLWEMPTRQLLDELPVDGAQDISALGFSRDGALLVAGGSTRQRLFEVRHNRPDFYRAPEAQDIRLVSTKSQEDRRPVGDSTGIVFVWRLPGLERKVIRPEGGDIVELGFAADDRTLVASTSDDELIAFDRRDLLKNPLPQRRILATGLPTTAFALHPTRNVLAAILDEQVFLWDLTRGTLVGEPWTGHTSTVYGIAYSADGRFLATGGSDGRVIIWDAETGLRIGEFGQTGYWFSEVAFGAGDTSLVSGTDQPNVLFWDVDAESWLRQACAIANRNLTPREWEQYVGTNERRKTCPGLL